MNALQVSHQTFKINVKMCSYVLQEKMFEQEYLRILFENDCLNTVS